MVPVNRLIIVHVERQVELAFPQIVGLRAVLKPGQLQGEIADAVPQIDQLEGTVGRRLLPHRLQTQGFLIKGQALLQIQHIKIEMIKFYHRINLLLRAAARGISPMNGHPRRPLLIVRMKVL